MKDFFILICWSILWSSCMFIDTEEPHIQCRGFEGEPFFDVHRDPRIHKVIAINDKGDSTPTRWGEMESFKLPFDLNSSRMEYVFYTEKDTTSLWINYTLETVVCEANSEVRLQLASAVVDPTSTMDRLTYTGGATCRNETSKDKQHIKEIADLPRLINPNDPNEIEFCYYE